MLMLPSLELVEYSRILYKQMITFATAIRAVFTCGEMKKPKSADFGFE